MSFVDPIGDMISRIRNAQMRSLSWPVCVNLKLDGLHVKSQMPASNTGAEWDSCGNLPLPDLTETAG